MSDGDTLFDSLSALIKSSGLYRGRWLCDESLVMILQSYYPKTKEVDGITFHIKRFVKDSFIIKEIDVTDNGEVHHYMEKVQALDLKKMKQFAQAAGLEIQHVFGALMNLTIRLFIYLDNIIMGC